MTAQDLKNSILQMAVQGKLVPQDPNDEPASVLLQRIQAEKEKLIKAGKLKKEKNPSIIFRGSDNLPYEKVGKEVRCIADAIPFEIPDSWVWVKCGNVFQHNTGKALNAVNRSGHLRQYITTSNLYWDRFELQKLREMFFTDAELEKYSIKKGDLLVCEGGDVGRAAIWNIDMPMCIQNHIHRLRSFSTVCIKFFYYLFFLYKMTGLIGGKGIGIQGLSSNAIHALLFPLPPLPEQKRIVSKIEEILPHLREYEEAEARAEKLNAEFPEQLKKSILQWAIQGKLVPQDPNDEPADVLLERIRAEKAKLIKAGKLKKDKDESFIYRRDNSHYEKLNGKERCIDDEIPFEIPLAWCWSRLGTVCQIARGGSPRPIKSFITDAPDGINWIKIGDTDKRGKYINATKEKIKLSGAAKSRMVHAGDFLLTNSMSFGRPYILNIDGCIHDGWLVLTGYAETYDRDFLYIMLSSAFAYKQFCGVVSGAVVQNLNSDKVANALFPIPPIEEQKRIVKKVNALLNLISI